MLSLTVALLDVIALLGGTVHTLADDAPAGIATVLIADGRIQAVGADLEVPADARVIDVAGLHVVPGLVDGVVSFESEHDVLYLAAGVTLVRDHGSPYASLMHEKDIRLRDRNPGPYLLLSGPALGGTAPSRADVTQLLSPAHASQFLERTLEILSAAGAAPDAFAIDGSIAANTLPIVAQFAERAGVLVFGPKPQRITLQEARSLGQRGLVGLDSILPAGVTWTQEAELPDLTPTVRVLAEGGWVVAPLLYGTARIVREPGAGDASLIAQLSPTLELAWLADAQLFAQQQARGLQGPWRRALERQRAFVRQLHEAGVQLLPASGAPSPWIPPGRAIALELGEWAAAGIPAADILRLATRDAAAALGHSERRGRIAPGYSADLAVLGADPLAGTSAFDEPQLVVVRGRALERFDIEELVAALVAQQRSVREAQAVAPELEPPDMPEGDLVLAGQVDTRAFGQRLSTERFAVVKLADGALVYGARVELPPSASESARRMHLVQTVRDGVVDSFELMVGSVEDGEDALESIFGARGQRRAADGRMTIDRRFGRKLLDTVTAEQHIALIDMCTVVTGLIVGRHFPEGTSYVLSFEGPTLESTLDRWRMQVHAEDRRIDVLTSRGFMAFGLEADGVPRFGIKEQGGAHLELDRVRAEVRGGAGFGLPEGRIFRPVEVPVEKSGDGGGGGDGGD